MVRQVRAGRFHQSEVLQRAMSVVYGEIGGGGLGLQDLTGIGAAGGGE